MSVTRYTRFVMLGKRFLWVLIASMVGAIIWVGSSDEGGEGPRLVFSNVQQSGALENVMLKPHYQGIDGENRPYTVIAERAKQLDEDTVVLETINADMLRSDEGKKATWLALTAKDGQLNTKTKQMKLSGGVNLFYEGGYEFRSEHAHVDIQEGTARGEAHVEGQGPFGTLTADGFDVRDRGQVIRFNGSVRMKLYP